MPWDGKYYYRSRRINGRPRRVYVGTGTSADLAAQDDEQARLKDERDRVRLEAAREEHAKLDAELDRTVRLADTLARAAMHAAGYHLHCRGEWRRKRGGR